MRESPQVILLLARAFTWHTFRGAVGTMLSLLDPIMWFESCVETPGSRRGRPPWCTGAGKPLKRVFAYPMRFAVIDRVSPPSWFTRVAKLATTFQPTKFASALDTTRVRLLKLPWAYGYFLSSRSHQRVLPPRLGTPLGERRRVAASAAATHASRSLN